MKKQVIWAGLFILILGMLKCETPSHQKSNMSKNATQQIGGTFGTVQKDTVNWVGLWKGEGQREVFIKNAIREFNFSNPDIYINFKFREEIPEFLAINSPIRDMPDALFIANMIRQNKYDWDVILMVSSSMYQYVGDALNSPHWGHEYLVNFADVPGFEETQNADVFQNEVFRQSYDNIFLGPFIEGTYYVIYCNQDLAEKVGFEVKQFDMTIDDLIEAIKKIDAYNQANGTHIAPFYENSDWITLSILFEHLFRSAINYSLDYQAPETFTKSHQIAFKRCLDAFEQMGHYRPVIESQGRNAWTESRHLVLEDKAVFYINGTWMYNMWESIDSSKVHKMLPCELPVFQKINFYNGEYKANHAVLKQSPRREQAIKALMHLASEDVALDWIRMAKSPTGVKVDFEQFGAGGDANEAFVIQMIQKYGKNIGNAAAPIFGTSNTGVSVDGEGLLAILRGEKTADDMFREYMAKGLK